MMYLFARTNTYQLITEETTMKYGARNRIRAKVKSVRKGDVMSLVKFIVTDPHEMASVLTTESVDHLNINQDD